MEETRHMHKLAVAAQLHACMKWDVAASDMRDCRPAKNLD